MPKHRRTHCPLQLTSYEQPTPFVLIDNHTQVCWTYLLKGQFETAKIFWIFHKMVQNPNSHPKD